MSTEFKIGDLLLNRDGSCALIIKSKGEEPKALWITHDYLGLSVLPMDHFIKNVEVMCNIRQELVNSVNMIKEEYRRGK